MCIAKGLEKDLFCGTASDIWLQDPLSWGILRWALGSTAGVRCLSFGQKEDELREGRVTRRWPCLLHRAQPALPKAMLYCLLFASLSESNWCCSRSSLSEGSSVAMARAALSSFTCPFTMVFYNPVFMGPVCSSPRREGKIIILIMNVSFNQLHLTLWELNFYLSPHTLNMGLYLLMQNWFAIILSFGPCHVNRGISTTLTAWCIICRSRLEGRIQPPWAAAAGSFVSLSFPAHAFLLWTLFGAAHWPIVPSAGGAWTRGRAADGLGGWAVGLWRKSGGLCMGISGSCSVGQWLRDSL